MCYEWGHAINREVRVGREAVGAAGKDLGILHCGAVCWVRSRRVYQNIKQPLLTHCGSGFNMLRSAALIAFLGQ